MRQVAVLPVRQLGYREELARQPTIGLGQAGAAVFVSSASFEECAALCGDDCLAVVRRTSGPNCWLIPATAYPGGTVLLDSWSGGTTYVKLRDCDSALPSSCDEVFGVPCSCEDYTVQNTIVHNGWEYASLDDAAAQPERCEPRWDPSDAAACAAVVLGDPASQANCESQQDAGGRNICMYSAPATDTTYNGRCPNAEPNCPGSTCANGLSGQNYFLRLPCGWDFFRLFPAKAPGASMAGDDLDIWNNVVTLGWGTSCINDVFTGAALWATGPNAGFDDSATIGNDYQNDQITNECGQMHPQARVSAATNSYRGWYTEFSPVAGFRSLSCGRRFLIRRPVGCMELHNATGLDTSDCSDMSDTLVSSLTASDPMQLRRVGSCGALTTVLRDSGTMCDVMTGPNLDVSVWDACCVTCERKFGVRPDRQVSTTSTAHGLTIDTSGTTGTATQAGNWAMGTNSVILDTVSPHTGSYLDVNINDGQYGNGNAWSGGQASGTAATISVGYAFTNLQSESTVVLVDAIAFGRDNSPNSHYHNNYAGAYTIQISQYSVRTGTIQPGNNFATEFQNRLADAEGCGETPGMATPAVCDTVVLGVPSSQSDCEAVGCVYTGQWETLDTLLYDVDSPDDTPWKRHYFRLTPPVPATAIRIVTSSAMIVIDEFEVYGTSPMSPNWIPTSITDNNLLVAATVTDSSVVGAAIPLIDATTDPTLTVNPYPTSGSSVANWPSPGAEVVAEFSTLQIVYEVAFRAEINAESLHIRSCKMSFVDRNGVQQFVTETSISTDPQDAVDIISLDQLGAPPAEMATDGGLRKPLPVPIETNHVRFYDIQGLDHRDIVKVQFGLSGKADVGGVQVQTDDAQLDVSIGANGFDTTVGCDQVVYEVIVRHKPGSPGAIVRDLRLSDMLSDPKLELIPGLVSVDKQNTVDGSWSPVLAGGGATFHFGNGLAAADACNDNRNAADRTAQPVSPCDAVVLGAPDTQADCDAIGPGPGPPTCLYVPSVAADMIVMVDVATLFKDQVLRLRYSVQVLEPEPLDIISSMAVVELLTGGPDCTLTSVTAGTCTCGPTGCLTAAPGCGEGERLIAKHTLESDVGTLSFDSSVSYGDSTTPYAVTIDGRPDGVFMINMDINVLLSAGTATNVLFKLMIPEDRRDYFELLSVDNLDNTGSRSAVSEDEAVLLMGELSVLTEAISVPCAADGSNSSAGLSLALTSALYNSFYYSDDYSCQLTGCSELSLTALLEYDLVSDTIFHDRISGERLYNTTRQRGASLPTASLEALGVHYSGGNPTWPLFTVQLDNKAMPDQGTYEGKITIEGSFEGMNGRLSVIASGGLDEFFITRNQLNDQPGASSFGTIGRIISTSKSSTSGDDWDLSSVITSSVVELRIKVMDDATFLTGTIDGHVVTTMFNTTRLQLGDGITISVFKELETDDVTISAVDASFVCSSDCSVRHSETHEILISRPGSPPNDISLTSLITTGLCGDPVATGYDACVTERAVEGTAVASISTSDADWSIGDTYRYEIIDQTGGVTFRLSSTLASRNDEVLLEVATPTIPDFYDQQELTVLLTVRDNLWYDHFFTKLVTIRVLAYPQKVTLSPSINFASAYVVPEGTAAGAKLADLAAVDPDATASSTVTFQVSGDDASFFEVQGSELLVAANVAGGALPSLQTQSFFDIVITAVDWNGLQFAEVVELTSSDNDECLVQGTGAVCAATAQCLNSVGSYQCLCPDGSSPAQDLTGATCDEINECAVNNGNCGDISLVVCAETIITAQTEACGGDPTVTPAITLCDYSSPTPQPGCMLPNSDPPIFYQGCLNDKYGAGQGSNANNMLNIARGVGAGTGGAHDFGPAGSVRASAGGDTPASCREKCMRGGIASAVSWDGATVSGPPTPYFTLDYDGPAGRCACIEEPVACMFTDPAETGSESCGGAAANVAGAATGLPNFFFGGGWRMGAFGPAPTRYECGGQPWQPLGTAFPAPIAGGTCTYGGTYPVAGGVFPNLTPPALDCDPPPADAMCQAVVLGDVDSEMNCQNVGGCIYTAYRNAGFGFDCVDVDECLVNNGGCGDPLNVACVNQHAGPPVCDDICECAAGACGVGALCTDFDQQGSACATPSWSGAVEAGTLVTLDITGNVALGAVDIYAMMTSPDETPIQAPWSTIAVTTTDNPPGCDAASGACSMQASFTPTVLGKYYFVVNNQGRSMQGSPFQIDVAATPVITTLDVSGDGLVGGSSSTSGYPLKVMPKDALGNTIFIDVTAEITSNLAVSVANNNPTAGVPTVPAPTVSQSSQPGVYDVVYAFSPKPISTYTVVVSWAGVEVTRQDLFNIVAASSLGFTAVDYSTTTLEVKVPPVSGIDGIIHVQTRDSAGNPLQYAPCDPTCADVYSVVVNGPVMGLTMSLTDLSRANYPGVIEGRMLADAYQVAGTYTATIRAGAVVIGTITVNVEAAAIVAATSTVVSVKGPFPVDPTQRTGLAGEAMQLQVVPRDIFGNDANFEDLDSRLTLKMVPLFAGLGSTATPTPIIFGACAECSATCVAGMVSRSSDGSYIGRYMVTEAGLYELSAEIDGLAVDGMPMKVIIGPATAVSFSSSTRDGHFTAAAGQLLSMPLVFSDAYDNSGAFPAGSVFVSLTSSVDPTVIIIPAIESLRSGLLTVTATFELAGEYTFDVQIADATGQLVSVWNQGLVKVLPSQGVTGAVTQIDTTGTRTALGAGGDGSATVVLTLTAGITNALEVNTVDTFGNAATGGSHVTAVLGSIVPGVFSVKSIAAYDERYDQTTGIVSGFYTFSLDVAPSSVLIPNDIQLRVYVDDAQIFLAKVIIGVPASCAVSTTMVQGQPSSVVAAGQAMTLDVALTDYPNVAAATVEVQFTSASGVVVMGVAGAEVGGVFTVTTTLSAAETYSIAVTVSGDSSLCEAPSPFVFVVPAAPDAATTSLSISGAGALGLGDTFDFAVASMDQFNNKIFVDPFNPLWTSITVAVYDEVTGAVLVACIQLTPGEGLPPINKADQIRYSEDLCFIDSNEVGIVVVASASGDFSVRAAIGATAIAGSPSVFTVAPVPVDPDWDITVVQPQLVQQTSAGSAQRLTVRVQDRATGIFVTASHVAIAWLVNDGTAASCCAICSCQGLARVSTVVAQSVDNGIQLISTELHTTGTYTIAIEHSTSGVTIQIPGQVVINAGTPVGALYSLDTAWPDTIKAGAVTEFSLLANDVFGNRVAVGGDLISADAQYCTLQPNNNPAVTCLQTPLPAYIAAGDVSDNDDGSYTVSYRPTLSGDYEVSVVRLGDGPIPHHPWRVRVEPGSVDPGLTTLVPSELLQNGNIRLAVQDSFGNDIVDEDPGVAFSYMFQFSLPHTDCGTTGDVCIDRSIATITADRNEATDIGNAIDGLALTDSNPTWLVQAVDHQTVEVVLELASPGPIDRLRVVTFADEQIENEGTNAVTISIYTSIDGQTWVPVEGLVDGYLGTEFLPNGATIDPDGPSVGAAHIENMERYVPAWTVMFSSRFIKYLRMDISAAEGNPTTKYPVREIQLSDCRCVHGQYSTGLVVYDNGYYQQSVSPGGFNHAGDVTLSVMYGLQAIKYEPDYLGEPYKHIVGSSLDNSLDTTVCQRYYTDEVIVVCDAAEYCTPACSYAFTSWLAKVNGCNVVDDFRDIQHFCLHTSVFDSNLFYPSLVVPGASPGIANGMLAGEPVQIEMLLSDPDGKTVSATSQWLNSGQLFITIDGPTGSVDADLQLTLSGAAIIVFTPTSVGDHTVSAEIPGASVFATTVAVTKGRAPAIVTAKFTPDGTAVRIAFDAIVSSGQGGLDCALILRSAAMVTLGTEPVCNWFDSQILTVVFGNGATLIPGDVLEILPGVITRIDVDSATAQGAVVVKHPDVGDLPSFCVDAQINLGFCEGLELVPGCLDGGGGRPLVFEYLVHPSVQLAQADQTTVDGATGSLTLGASSFVASQPTEFFVRAVNFLGYVSMERSVVITRQGGNRLPVMIDGDAELVLDKDDYLFIQGGMAANTCFTIPTGADIVDTFEWSQLGGEPVDFSNDVQVGGASDPYMYISPGTMRPGERYTFQLTAMNTQIDTTDVLDSCTSTDVASSAVMTSDITNCALASSTDFGVTPGSCTANTGTFTCTFVHGVYSASGALATTVGVDTVQVTVRESDLVVKVDGCDHTVFVNDTLVLDAAGSVDPDTPTLSLVTSNPASLSSSGGLGAGSIETLFRWTCVMYAADTPSVISPCMQKSATSEALSINSDLRIPPGSMDDGNVYQFTVDVTALSVYSGIKKLSSTVTITPTSDAVPQLMINTPPFSRRDEQGDYATNANDQLVLVAGLGAGTQGTVEYRWRFLVGGTDTLSFGSYSPANVALTLAAGSLTPGQTCVVQLEGRIVGGNPGMVGKATVRFTVGDVPSGGNVDIAMANLASQNTVGSLSQSGVSLQTDYTFTFAGWANVEVYKLMYKDCSSPPCTIQTLTMDTRIPVISTQLSSAIMDPISGVVTVVAVAVDKFGSTTSVSLDIAIEPNAMDCAAVNAVADTLRGDLQQSLLGSFATLVQREYQDGGCRSAGADAVQRQVRWMSAATADNFTCVAEVQQRLRPTGYGWGRWSGTYTDILCTQTQTRTMYEQAIVDVTCNADAQMRTRVNNELWSDWITSFPGQFNEQTCSTAETRVAWKQDQTSGGQLCEKAQQYQITVDNGTPVPWAGLYDTVGEEFTYLTCTETETRNGYVDAAPPANTPCVTEVQTRSRTDIDVDAAGADGLGGWSAWSGAITACTETGTRYRYQTGYSNPCVAEQQTRTRAAGDVWSAFSGTYDFLSCITIPADPATATSVELNQNNAQTTVNAVGGLAVNLVVTQLGTRERFHTPLAAASDGCEAETQVRTTAEDGEWSPWSGSFQYISCALVDVVDKFQMARAKACVSQAGVRTKECIDSACVASWTPPEVVAPLYTGDYPVSTCVVYEAQQTFSASGFGVPEDMSGLGTYQCDALDQERDLDSVTGEFGQWAVAAGAAESSRPFDVCDFEVSRVRWALPLAVGGACTSEVQTRSPVVLDGGALSWAPWTGSFQYAHCTERQTRYRYSSLLPGCQAGTESRWRTDQSSWFGDVFLSEQGALSAENTFAYDDCEFALPQERTAYLDQSPDAATGCVSEQQVRMQTDAGWGPWDNNVASRTEYTNEACLVEETRTRWVSLPDGCQSELQNRYKNTNDAWSPWSGSFPDSTCTDTRTRFNNRFVGAGYTFDASCVGTIAADSSDCAAVAAFVSSGLQADCPIECTFSDAVNPTCISEQQVMTGSEDGSVVWTGSTGFIYETCEEIEGVTRWLAPLSWDGPCQSAARTRRRTSGDTLWGAYSAPEDYIYDSCVQYQSRERFSFVDGDTAVDNVCLSETQIRSCVDCSGLDFNWSPWSGTYIFPLCRRSLALDPAFDNVEDVQQRVQFQQQMPELGEQCKNETQVRVRLPEENGLWTPWSGDFVYAFCPFDGTIEQRIAWIKSAVSTPEECISESQTRYNLGVNTWTSWFGDFSYTSCTETETSTFYQAAVVVDAQCVAAQQTRSRTDRGAWTGWSGAFVESNCTEVQERLHWQNRYATGGDVCLSELQNRTRFPGQSWLDDWSGDITTFAEAHCTEIQERTKWESSTTATGCTSQRQMRTRDDGGVLTAWNGTFPFATCQQSEQRTRYDSNETAMGQRCNAEIQTRDNINSQGWSSWTGNPIVFKFDTCLPGAPTVETRIRWQISTAILRRCRSEVQQRTVSRDDPNPAWGGSFNFPSCTEVQERYRYGQQSGPQCIFEKQTRSAAGTSQAWNDWTGTMTVQNCTEERYQWRESDDSAALCESELQTRYIDSDRVSTDWSGTFNFTACLELDHRLRWRMSTVECQTEQWVAGVLRNPSTGNPTRDCGLCESETVTRGRLSSAVGVAGAWSAWNGTVLGRAAFVFDECKEVDIRRRFQYPLRNASIAIATGVPSLTMEENLLNADCMLSSEAQTRNRVNNGPWSQWSGTPDFIHSQCSSENFQTEQRVRWYEPNTDNTACLYETQVRNLKPWVGGGVTWGEWSGSYIYATCTEYATQTRYENEAVVDSPCRAAVGRRQRIDGGTWTDWASQYNYSFCLQTEHRTAWRDAEIAGLCMSEYQTRTMLLPDDGGNFSNWDGLWVEPHCAQKETRMKWRSPTASTYACEGQMQNRTRIDNGDWSCWDGTYLFDGCTQTQRRNRYDVIAAPACQQEVQERQRDGYGTFTAWTGTFIIEDCVQPGQQTDERDRYREDGLCTYEKHSRTRSNGGRWSDWLSFQRDGAPNPTVNATLESCVEMQSRYRYVSINNMCVQAESLRYREGSVSGQAGWNPWSQMGGC